MDPSAPSTLTPLPLWQSQEWRAAQHAGSVTRILPLSGSNKLITAGRDGTVRVFRATDLHPLQACTASEAAWVSDAAVATLDGQRRLAVASLDRAISFFNVLPAERDPHRPDETSCLGLAGRLHDPASFGPATALAALPGGSGEDRLVLGDQRGGVFLLRKQPPMMGKSVELNPKTDLEKLHAGKHGEWVSALVAAAHVGLLSASLDGSIAVFDPTTGFLSSCSKTLHGGAAVRCLSYHEPMTMAVSGGAGRSALLWHPRGDPTRAVGELKSHEGGVVAVSAASFDSSTHTVATVSGSGVFSLWDLRTMRPLHRAEKSADFAENDDVRPSAVAFDPERRRVITAARRPAAWAWGPVAAEEKEKGTEDAADKPVSTEIVPPEGEEQQKGAAVESAGAEVWRRAHSRLVLL